MRRSRLVSRVGGGEPERDGAHLFARLFERHVRPQPGNHIQVERAALRRQIASVKRCGNHTSDWSG